MRVLRFDHHDRTVTVQLDHGPVNALDIDLCTALASTIVELDGDPDVTAIVLTGQPGVFSAGVDLERLDAADEDELTGYLAAVDGAFRSLLGCETPIVGAITGHAISGGAVLTAACDHAVVTDDPHARLGLNELNVGVPLPTSAIEIVRARCPQASRELVWRAQLYDPLAAHALGLVDEVVAAEEVRPRAQAVAAALGAAPAVTRSLTRQQLWADARERVAARGGTWEPQVVAGWCGTEVRGAVSRFVAERLR